LIQGGAVINSSGAAIIGFADVIDSLAAIERVVFVEKSVTFADLLKAAWTPISSATRRCWRACAIEDKTPKYGNEDPAADGIARWLAAMLDDLYAAKENYRGGHYRVGYWTMTNHAGFGLLSKATPNGRRAGQNFTSGITPVSGDDPKFDQGPQFSGHLCRRIFCRTAWPSTSSTRPRSVEQSKMLDNFMASVEAYFDAVPGKRDGGMEIQFNVTTHDTFVDAGPIRRLSRAARARVGLHRLFQGSESADAEGNHRDGPNTTCRLATPSNFRPIR
jgi:pyruvate-formate lyase